MHPIIRLSLLALCISACSDSTQTESPAVEPEPLLDHSGLMPLETARVLDQEYLAGGDATLFVFDEDAFSTRPAMIAQNFKHDGNFTSGDHLFRTPHHDIGPLLNTGTCQGCHLNDGRGVVPSAPDRPMTSMLVKLGRADGNADPVYGDQIQPFALQSFTTSDFESGFARYLGSINGDALYGEAFPFVEYEVVSGTYPDGIGFELRNPVVKVKDMSFGDFAEDIRFSARLAPQVFGAGLLEAIPQDHILKLADPDDTDSDGISGRASMVTEKYTGETKLGRFAYKAQNPSVLQQVAGAYNGDIGITTSLFGDEPCTDAQLACQMTAEQERRVGEEKDFSDLKLAMVEFYNRVLGVPARRGYDADSQTWSQAVVTGRKLFMAANCSGCHTPRHVTGEAAGSLLGEISLVGLEPEAEPIAMLSEQTIFPYTDLLLHDMGGSCAVTRELADGSNCDGGEQCFYVQRCDGLADGLIQGDASGSEWKTPALWGLGLVQIVNPKSTFLHDGRARTIEEAILWHGSEAEASKLAFMALTAEQRADVLTFLESL